MKLTHPRATALFAFLPLAGFVLSGCPKQVADANEAPYGQPASQTADVTSPAAPDTVVPPGPNMGTASDTDPEGTGAVDAPPGPKMGGPMMGGGGDPMAPLTPTPELDKAIQTVAAGGDKKKIAAAYASRGYSRMMDDNAGQRIKYRKALEDFRVALKNDPANAKAKDNMATIETIYKSMGRPVPQ